MTGLRAVVGPPLRALFPASLARTAARAGTICVTLAVCVAFLFPVTARAGTETTAARWTTATALLAGGIALRLSRGHPLALGAALLVLFVGAVAAPAWWLLLLAAGGAFYVATALVPRTAPPPLDEEPDTLLAVAARAGLGAPVPVPPLDELDPPATELQEILESIAMALVLALVVREFGFEAFKIPTGSMKPTILGDEGKKRGDMLLASKTAPIRRWDIAVFRYPLFRNTNYIKRIVGLPGEHVELRAGDVYVDGTIVPKPDDVQEVMWRRALETKPGAPWIDDFDPDDRGAWTFREGYAEVDAKGETAWAQARMTFEEDFRASFDVELAAPASEGSQLLVSLEGAQRRVVVALTPHGLEAELPGARWTPKEPTLTGQGERFRLAVSVSDRVLRVWIDGRLAGSLRHPDETNGGLDQGRLRLGAKDLKATLRALRVENDVQYGMYETREWTTGEGYVALGDNTGSSRDSRYWRAHVVKLKDGREFVAPDRARVTDDDERDVFHERPDGGVDFIDSYGVPRSFSKDEVAEIRRHAPQPYVLPDDLVGRAFFIFFPVPPFGDFRPRFLR